MSKIERLGNLILSNGGDSRVRVSSLVRLVPEEDRTSSFKQYSLKLQTGEVIRVFKLSDFDQKVNHKFNERVFIKPIGRDTLMFFMLASKELKGEYFRARQCSPEVGMNLPSFGFQFCPEYKRKRFTKLILEEISAAEGPEPTAKVYPSTKGQEILERLRAMPASPVESPFASERTWKILVLHPETFETVGTVKELFKSKEAVLSKMAELAKLRPEAVFVKAELQERVQAKMALVWE